MAEAIPAITDTILSTRLGELQEEGLVRREVLAGPPIASVYELTASGAALRPALMALAGWAEDHMPPPPVSAP
jgi:DNA-binding HxlR family transcriptional regulator